jgi:hypothetical protein
VLVLGSFPVRHRTVLAGKFGALAGFFGLIWIAMHGASAVFYGLYLGGQTGVVSALRTLVAHFRHVGCGRAVHVPRRDRPAGSAARRGAGPRLFARLAPLLQVAMITGALLLFAMLPWTAQAAPGCCTTGPRARCRRDSSSGCRRSGSSGCYDTILGIGNARVHTLALQALAALGGVAALAFLSYPLAYRRVVTDALVGSPVPARRGIRAAIDRASAHDARTQSIGQATLQFALSTIGRSSLHRLIIAASVGVGAAFVVPLIAVNLDAPLPAPTPGTAVVAHRRHAAAPGRHASRHLAARRAPRGLDFSRHRFRQNRNGLRSPRAGCCGSPPSCRRWRSWSVSYYAIWGPRIAGLHLLLCSAAGLLTTELLLSGFNGVACAKAYTPGAAKLQARWPLYLLVIAMLTIHVPQGEAMLLNTPWGVPILAGFSPFRRSSCASGPAAGARQDSCRCPGRTDTDSAH